MRRLLYRLLGIDCCRACYSRDRLQHFNHGVTLCARCSRRVGFALRAVLAP